jgi:peptidoglycan/LPS O-acetylase OafA/YrhL
MTCWDSRKNNFDLLRLGLAVLVIYSHAYPLGVGSEAAEPFARWTQGQVTGGGFAVDSFFIMSGFLIAASAERSRTIGSFLIKRVRRIYPAFLVSALLTLLVVLPLAGGHLARPSLPSQIGNFLLSALRLVEFDYTGAFATNPLPNVINGSTWSISYEFWCYLGVAGMTAAGLLRRRWLVLGLFVVAWIIGVAFRIEGWILGGKLLGAIVGPPQFWARLLPLYLAGVVFYLFRDRIPLRNSLAAACALLMLVTGWFSFGWALLFPVAGAYLLLWLAFTPLVRLHHAGRFGDFSYGTYLYAFPIEQLVMQRVGHPLAPWLLFVCATPLALLAAVASWYGVERWFLQPSRRNEGSR